MVLCDYTSPRCFHPLAFSKKPKKLSKYTVDRINKGELNYYFSPIVDNLPIQYKVDSDKWTNYFNSFFPTKSMVFRINSHFKVKKGKENVKMYLTVLKKGDIVISIPGYGSVLVADTPIVDQLILIGFSAFAANLLVQEIKKWKRSFRGY